MHTSIMSVFIGPICDLHHTHPPSLHPISLTLTPSPSRFIRKILLDHPPNFPIRIEMLPHSPLFIKRSSNLLRRAANRSVRVEHRAYGAVF